MKRLICLFLIITLTSQIRSESDNYFFPPEDTKEWDSEFRNWRRVLSEWKGRIEEECVIDMDRWKYIFKCLDYSAVACTNANAYHFEIDAFNCHVTVCTDGRYSKPQIIQKIWRQQFNGYKKLLDYYQKELSECRSRDCPEQSTTTVASEESSTAIPITAAKTVMVKTTKHSPTNPMSTQQACNSPSFDFRKQDHVGYVQYNGSIPEMTSFTACVWVTPPENGTVKGTLLSYCATGTDYCNTFGLYFTDTHFGSFGQVGISTPTSPPTSRSHYCMSVSDDEQKVKYYIDGTNVTESGHGSVVIPGGGVLILGQDQDGSISGSTPGPPGNADDGFFGRLDGFLLWDRAISAEEVQGLYNSGCNCATDAIVAFDSANSIVVDKEEVYADLEHRC